MTQYCPFCGVEVAEKGVCTKETCVQASARIPLAVKDSRGTPILHLHRTQSEASRKRKLANIRLLPELKTHLHAYAAEHGGNASAIVERWIRTLPLSGPTPGAEPEKDSEKNE
jgi:hypothetical protein